MMKCQWISGKVYQTFARFDVIILHEYYLILGDLRMLKRMLTLFEKLELIIGQVNKILLHCILEKEMCNNGQVLRLSSFHKLSGK